jgi:predicted Zn-dependent peptidase
MKQDGLETQYDAKQNTLVTVFNNYFGGGMGSIVFQTIRESKALLIVLLVMWLHKENDLLLYGYIGSQADKFKDAATSMNDY